MTGSIGRITLDDRDGLLEHSSMENNCFGGSQWLYDRRVVLEKLKILEDNFKEFRQDIKPILNINISKSIADIEEDVYDFGKSTCTAAIE